MAFDVALHIGTLAAVLAVFGKDCVRYVKAVIFFRDPKRTTDRRLAGAILVGILPAGLVGYFLEDMIDSVLRSPWIVVVMLIVIAFVFLAIERLPKARFTGTVEQVTWKNALFIGVLQVLAFIPGTSRSGTTIVAGMLSGLTREAAARFSFLISIPLIFAAALNQMLGVIETGFTAQDMQLFLVGIVSSGVVGYLAIRFLLQYLASHSLQIFALYRIILAVVVTCLLVVL